MKEFDSQYLPISIIGLRFKVGKLRRAIRRDHEFKKNYAFVEGKACNECYTAITASSTIVDLKLAR